MKRCAICGVKHIPNGGISRTVWLTKAGYLLLAQMRAAENAKRRAA